MLEQFFTLLSKSTTMQNYIIYFHTFEPDAVLHVLRRSNDILIHDITADHVGITIQTEDAPEVYRALLEQLEREAPHTGTASYLSENKSELK